MADRVEEYHYHLQVGATSQIIESELYGDSYVGQFGPIVRMKSNLCLLPYNDILYTLRNLLVVDSLSN